MKRNKTENKTETELSNQTVRLDPAFLKRVKMKMLDSGDSLQSLVVRLLDQWLDGVPANAGSASGDGSKVNPELIKGVLDQLASGETLPTISGKVMVVPELLSELVGELIEEVQNKKDLALVDRAFRYCAPFLDLELDNKKPRQKRESSR